MKKFLFTPSFNRFDLVLFVACTYWSQQTDTFWWMLVLFLGCVFSGFLQASEEDKKEDHANDANRYFRHASLTEEEVREAMKHIYPQQ